MTITPADVLDSNTAFRNNFNPRHPSYHGGDPTPVPLGGQRIPEGCVETQSAEKDADWIPTPEYKAILSERNHVGTLKAQIAEASKLVGIISQQQQVIKVEDVSAAKAQLEQKINGLSALLHTYTSTATFSYQADVMGTVSASIALLRTVPVTKEEYGSFILDINKLTRQLFVVQGKLLKTLKEIKANWAVASNKRLCS